MYVFCNIYLKEDYVYFRRFINFSSLTSRAVKFIYARV